MRSLRLRRLLFAASTAALAASCVTDPPANDTAMLIVVKEPLTSEAQGRPRPQLPVRCFGPEGADRQAIFLHGIMPMTSNGQPPTGLDDAERLRALATATGWRIAAPLSRFPCGSSYGKSYCWTGSDAAAVAATWSNVVLSATQNCLDPRRPLALLGFSNGGYHAARVAMRRTLPRPSFVVAMGSAGDVSHADGAAPGQCAPLTLLIGTKDVTRSKAQALARALQKSGQSVNFETFSGSHEVPWARLRAILKSAP